MKAWIATFDDAEAILAGAGKARAAGFVVNDTLTPYPLSSLDGFIGAEPPRLRGPMALAGFGLAAAFFAFETWTAVDAYPFNEGGRPLFSWPVFLLSPFEIGILAAAVMGFGCFLVHCGLPRMNHPLFTVPGIERASQGRFLLLVELRESARAAELRDLLFEAGAMAVSEAEA